MRALEISSIIWSLAVLRRTPDMRMQGALICALRSSIEDFVELGVSNIIWAIGHMQGWGDFGAQVWNAIHEVAIRQTPYISEAGVASMVWAASSLSRGESRDTLVQALCERVRHVVGNMQHMHVSMSMVGLARLGCIKAQDAVVEALCDRAEQIVDDLEAQGLSNLLWAFAKIGVKRRGLFHALMMRLRDGQAREQVRLTRL
jgi:hypothetical protein